MKDEQFLEFGRFVVGVKLDEIRDYLTVVDSGFARAFDEFDARVAAEAEKLPEAFRESLYEDESVTAFNLTEHFPSFTWQTTFVALYSLLEHEMFAACRQMRHIQKHLIGPEDLKDKGIFAAQKYVEKVCRVAFPEKGRPWQEILHYNKVRNVLVHNQGELKHTVEGLRQYVASRKNLSVDHNDELKLTRDFCLDVVSIMRQFFDELYQSLKKSVQ